MIDAPFFARGALLEGREVVHRSRDLCVDFATPRIDLDRVVHPEALDWSACASGGEFHVIAHAGHAPFLSHADAVAQALLPWLEANR